MRSITGSHADKSATACSQNAKAIALQFEIFSDLYHVLRLNPEINLFYRAILLEVIIRKLVSNCHNSIKILSSLTLKILLSKVDKSGEICRIVGNSEIDDYESGIFTETEGTECFAAPLN